MSTGKAHARASKALAPIAALGTGCFCQFVGDYLPGSILAGAGTLFGCGIVGQILSPDLDQPNITASEWYVIRRLGPLAGLWIAFWWPYAVLIKHRSALSHYPVVGTAGRLAYLFWGPLLAIKNWDTPVPVWAAVLFTGMIAGLAVSDMAHYVMDFRPKRRRRRAYPRGARR